MNSAAYKRAKAEYDKEMEDLQANKQQFDFVVKAHEAIKKELGKSTYTVDDLKKNEVVE